VGVGDGVEAGQVVPEGKPRLQGLPGPPPPHQEALPPVVLPPEANGLPVVQARLPQEGDEGLEEGAVMGHGEGGDGPEEALVVRLGEGEVNPGGLPGAVGPLQALGPAHPGPVQEAGEEGARSPQPVVAPSCPQATANTILLIYCNTAFRI